MTFHKELGKVSERERVRDTKIAPANMFMHNVFSLHRCRTIVAAYSAKSSREMYAYIT